MKRRRKNEQASVCFFNDNGDLPYTYKGETTPPIAAVTGDLCPACAVSVLHAAESDRVMREMRAFLKQVNAAMVDPAFITSVRKKLDLDQREAAEIFGGGVNAFSRYLVFAKNLGLQAGDVERDAQRQTIACTVFLSV